MSGTRRSWLTVVVGAGLIVAGAGVAVSGRPVRPGEVSAIAAATSIVLGTLGLLLALWHLAGDASAADARDAPARGDDGTGASDAIAAPAPEYSTSDDEVSGRRLPQLLETAGNEAREAGSVTAGVEYVRPALRETLIEALVGGGTDREAAEAAVETGAWTDDPVAAATLSPAVAGPPRSVRDRLFAWLFPERALRERVDRTVAAIASAAAAALPPVPGQDAPRTVPVANPGLSELQRRVDERLHPAVETDLRRRVDDWGASASDGPTDERTEAAVGEGPGSAAGGGRAGESEVRDA